MEHAPQRRTVWLALALMTIVAAALRLPFLGRQSLWWDEIYTRDVLRESSLASLWQHIKATESTPPLYYIVGWLLHARSTVAMRLISALALTASVPVAYLAFRRLIGWRAALACAAILAVDPLLVSYSTDARSYGLFVLTALLSTWGFAALLERGSWQRFGLWALASVACIWTHYFGVFVVGAEVAAVFVQRPGSRAARVWWTALIALCVAPLAPLAADQSGDERAGFIAGIPLTKRLSEAVRQFAMGPNVPRSWLEAAGLAIASLSIVAGLVVAMRTRRPGPRTVLALATFGLGVPLLLAMLGIEDRFYPRNVVAVLPLVVALASPTMLRLRAVPLVIYLLLATFVSTWVATDWRYEQVDWKSALGRAEAIDHRAAMVALTPFDAPVVQTYLARPTASTGVVAQRVWIIAEPTRGVGQRALSPASVPPLPGFSPLRVLELHAFQLVLLSASSPTRIAPTEIPGASLFSGR